MPIYEYVCRNCGAKYEKFVRPGTGEVELRCPYCNSERVEKAFSVFGTRASGSQATASLSSSAAACGPVG